MSLCSILLKLSEASIFPSFLFLKSWRTWRFLMVLGPLFLKVSSLVLQSMKEMEVPGKPGDGVIWHVSTLRYSCENFIQIQHQEPNQDSTCPPSPFLESWRTWRLLTNPEMVSYDMFQFYEVVVKILSKYNIMNSDQTLPTKSLSGVLEERGAPVKTLSVLQVSSQSLGGHVSTLWSCCEKIH